MICWKCNSPLDDLKIVPFSETCPKCHAWLHCCANCKFHQIGKPNECLIPNTDYIADREGKNFCDEFKPKDNATKAPDSKTKFDPFNSLFKD